MQFKFNFDDFLLLLNLPYSKQELEALNFIHLVETQFIGTSQGSSTQPVVIYLVPTICPFQYAQVKAKL